MHPQPISTPISFQPPLDVIAGDDEVVLELALPGVDRDDVVVEQVPGGLAVSGVRRDAQAERRSVHHAELPRGAFHRAIPVPFELHEAPRVELDRGVLRIHLAISAAAKNGGAGPKQS